MIRKLQILFCTIIFISCGNETNEHIYKTKTVEYASKTGNFIAKFPTEPKYSVLERKIGIDDFEIHVFRSTLGPNKIFSLEYIDYPENMIKSLSDSEIYSQGISNYSNKIADKFNLDFQKTIEQHGLKGEYFVFSLKPSLIEKGIEGHVLGILFRKENRVYTISYMGINDDKTGTFLDSFRLIN
ncbi:hypothetical protein [uncultured Psychroserpens sp.]|uniref:hypothetical protein n=1 Tax=uncultured Psychroserpens sp. TaxID=255436 RepID=UPI00262548BF|nr:hypothetical protein [uncultured Psychroserpens sp.]